VLEYDTEIRPSWQHMAAPKTLVTVADAGHYAFSDICALAPFFTDECDGPEAGWADIAWVQQLTRTTVLAHIQVELLGEERAAEYRASAWLAGEAGVTVER
jgi:predicted dienelactone hydrolase